MRTPPCRGQPRLSSLTVKGSGRGSFMATTPPMTSGGSVFPTTPSVPSACPRSIRWPSKSLVDNAGAQCLVVIRSTQSLTSGAPAALRDRNRVSTAFSSGRRYSRCWARNRSRKTVDVCMPHSDTPDFRPLSFIPHSGWMNAADRIRRLTRLLKKPGESAFRIVSFQISCWGTRPSLARGVPLLALAVAEGECDARRGLIGSMPSASRSATRPVLGLRAALAIT